MHIGIELLYFIQFMYVLYFNFQARFVGLRIMSVCCDLPSMISEFVIVQTVSQSWLLWWSSVYWVNYSINCTELEVFFRGTTEKSSSTTKFWNLKFIEFLDVCKIFSFFICFLKIFYESVWFFFLLIRWKEPTEFYVIKVDNKTKVL